MQNEQTLEQMMREYERMLPPEIMNLIRSFDYKKEVRTIVNQNQLMINTGADLEQSIYLMMLGAIKVEDLYERLTDTHELPDDKAKKIIQEVETLIFNPLHKKLIDLDEASPASSLKDTVDRDSILAEIEKEPEPIIKFDPSKINQSPQRVEEDAGIVKPFSMNLTKEIEVKEPELLPGKAVEGIQEDPIAVGLTQPTVIQAPIAPKPASIDPYREPIE